MAESTTDPLRDSIQQAAALIDVEAVSSEPESSDPMVRLFQHEIINGASAEDALRNTTARLAAVGGQALDLLGFPPSASTSFQIDRGLKEAGASELEISAAMSHLLASSQVDEINGWFFKVPAHERTLRDTALTTDDVDWLRGTGRFAQ